MAIVAMALGWSSQRWSLHPPGACSPSAVCRLVADDAAASAIRWHLDWDTVHVPNPISLIQEPAMRLEVDTTINASAEDVWAVLVDWRRQPEWMLDARSVTVVSDVTTGHGVTIHVPTTLLGIPVLDVMRVTGWDRPRRLEVTHLGRVIKGLGAFELASRGPDRTHLVWWEEVVAPLGRLGELGARASRPVLRAIFRRSIDGFRDLVEQESGMARRQS